MSKDRNLLSRKFNKLLLVYAKIECQQIAIINEPQIYELKFKPTQCQSSCSIDINEEVIILILAYYLGQIENKKEFSTYW